MTAKQHCRLCSTLSSPFVHIFGEEGKKYNIESKIRNINLSISEHDSLPKNICVLCYGKLEFIEKFCKSCHKAEEYFKNTSNKDDNELKKIHHTTVTNGSQCDIHSIKKDRREETKNSIPLKILQVSLQKLPDNILNGELYKLKENCKKIDVDKSEEDGKNNRKLEIRLSRLPIASPTDVNKIFLVPKNENKDLIKSCVEKSPIDSETTLETKCKIPDDELDNKLNKSSKGSVDVNKGKCSLKKPCKSSKKSDSGNVGLKEKKKIVRQRTKKLLEKDDDDNLVIDHFLAGMSGVLLGNQIEENSTKTPTQVGNNTEGNFTTTPTQVGSNIGGNFTTKPTQVVNCIQVPTQVVNFIQTPTHVGNFIQIPTQVGNLIKTPTQGGNLIKTPTLVGNSIQIPTQVGNLIKSPTQGGNLIKMPTLVGNSIQTPTQVGNLIKMPTLVGNSIQTPTQVGNLIKTLTQVGNFKMPPSSCEPDVIDIVDDEEDSSALPKQNVIYIQEANNLGSVFFNEDEYETDANTDIFGENGHDNEADYDFSKNILEKLEIGLSVGQDNAVNSNNENSILHKTLTNNVSYDYQSKQLERLNVNFVNVLDSITEENLPKGNSMYDLYFRNSERNKVAFIDGSRLHEKYFEYAQNLVKGRCSLIPYFLFSVGSDGMVRVGFKCFICSSFSFTRSSVLKHLHLHLDTVCYFCEFAGRTSLQLKFHMKKHLFRVIDEKIECKYCVAKFNVFDAYWMHLQLHYGHRCPLCVYQTDESDSLMKHMDSFHEEQRKTCSDCSVFYCKNDLMKHINDIRSTGFVCRSCKMAFHNEDFLNIHYQIYGLNHFGSVSHSGVNKNINVNKPEPLLQNPLVTRNTIVIDVNANDHTNLIQFFTDIFLGKIMEIKLRSSEDVLVCPLKYCSTRFPKTENNFFSHVKSHLLLTCQECKIICKDSTEFSDHQKNKTHVSSFIQCIVCKNILFSNLEKYLTHVQDHENKRVCSYCFKTFNNQEENIDHLKSMHKDMLQAQFFMCEKCGAQFANKYTFNRHLVNVHNENLTLDNNFSVML